MPKKSTPFVDFYTRHGIIPTRQDITDFESHLTRRVSLYTLLGVPPIAFQGSKIVEFGPGSGHNAVVTALLGPQRYILVDGNVPSLDSSKRLLREYAPKIPLSTVHSSILEFCSDEVFDIVLCEAVIPTQHNPAKFLRHVGSFAKLGGAFIYTCMDPISLFPEILRRWLAWEMTSHLKDFTAKVTALVKFFAPDINQLPGMSRKPEDWVIDQIVHPWSGPLFSIGDSLRVLDGKVMLLGTSPRFLDDWRWYKQLVGKEAYRLDLAIASYEAKAINLIDFRNTDIVSSKADSSTLIDLTQEVYDQVFLRERGRDGFDSKRTIQLLKSATRILERRLPLSARSLDSFISFINARDRDIGRLRAFRGWWGRGQQYVAVSPSTSL